MVSGGTYGMPVEYTIDGGRRLVRSRASGIVSFRDMRRSQRTLLADPRFVPTYREIVDFREVSAFDLSTEELRELAAVHVFAAGTRRAVVHPPSRPVFRGIVHMFEAFRELAGGHELIRAFDDMDLAMAWLDAQP
jgi:hypothetical protein